MVAYSEHIELTAITPHKAIRATHQALKTAHGLAKPTIQPET